METIKKQHGNEAWGTGLLIFLGILLIWHSRMSFCQSDESFYLSLVHRLWSGDRLILDEWNLSQFYSPLLLPLYALYRAVVPSGEGIYLFARVLQIIISLLCSLLIYRKCCRETGCFSAFIASALLLLYSRANIPGLSYYNLCLQFSLFSLICFLSDKKGLWFTGGIFLSCAVLCNPFLAIFAALAMIVVCFQPTHNARALYGALGILSSAGTYLVMLLFHGQPAKLLSSLKLMMGDPTHSFTLYNVVRRIASGVYHYIPPLLFVLTGIGCFFVVRCRRRGTKCIIIQTSYLLIGFLLLGGVALKAVSSLCFLVSVPFTLLMLPLVVEAYLKRKCFFALALYAEGLMLAAAFSLASNTGFDAMTVGFACSSAGGVLLLFSLKESSDSGRTKRYVQTGLSVCLCATLLGTFAAHRFLGIYRDAPIAELTERIEEGPAAGLYTTKQHAEEYAAIYSEIQKVYLRYPATHSVLFSKLLPWAYLATDWRCAAMTAWSVPIDDPRLEAYYLDHPKPDLVFLLAEDTAGYETAPFNNQTGNSHRNANSLKGSFYEEIRHNGVIVDKTPQMTVFHLQ